MTYPDLLVLSSCSQISSVGAEANATNVQISIFVDRGVLEVGDLAAGGHVEDLGGTIASGRDVFSI